MVQWDVQIGGVSVDALQDVETGSADDGSLGTARIVAGNTQANRNINFSDQATVYRQGEVEYEGPVTKKPSIGRSNERIEFTVADKRAELKLIEAHRPFYQMDPGEILREAVDQEATIKSPVTVFDASTTSGWDSDTPEFGIVGADDQQLQDRGTSVLGLGFPKGSNGLYEVRYDSVPSSAIPGDGQVVKLALRLLVNSVGDQFEVEVELNDNAGNTYVWPIERVTSNFETYEFPAEEAQSSSTIGGGSTYGQDGSLAIRFNLKGSLSENRAAALDYAESLPFTLSSREVSVDSGGVQDVGTTTTRRYDESVMEMLADLGEEFGHTSWVDEQDVLRFEPSGSEQADKEIRYDSTPVINAEVDRDSDQITNKVTVQGGEDSRGNPIQVTASDSASIQFYGLSEREDQIVDNTLQSREDAKRKAEGHLAEHAWDDEALSFRVASGAYTSVRVGQSILVDWPPEDILSQTFTVTGVEQQKDGSVTIKMSGSGA